MQTIKWYTYFREQLTTYLINFILHLACNTKLTQKKKIISTNKWNFTLQFITAKNLEVAQVSFNKWLLKGILCTQCCTAGSAVQSVAPSLGLRMEAASLLTLQPGERQEWPHTQQYGWSSTLLKFSEEKAGHLAPKQHRTSESRSVKLSSAQNSFKLSEERGWVLRGR